MISRSRFDVVHGEMTSVCQKVFAAVPASTFWSVGQIIGEMKRQGISIDPKRVSGCLDTLLHAGLVREQLRGHFCRSEIREPSLKPVLYEVEKEVVMPQPITSVPASTAKRTPLEILGDLSAQAVVLSDMVRKYAGEVEKAAIEIQEQLETGDAETAKLRQLQALLKSLG